MSLEFILQDDSRENAELHSAEVQITSIQWKISNQLETGTVLIIWSFKKQINPRGKGRSTSTNSFSRSTYLHDETKLVKGRDR